jgi:hypothetical protein
MDGGRGRGAPRERPPPGLGTSGSARRRRANRAADIARGIAAAELLRQSRAAEDAAHADLLAAADRARAARNHSDLLRDAFADAQYARLEARFQQGVEARLAAESAAIFQRASAAYAQAAREEALRHDLESRVAELRAEVLAGQEELARLRAAQATPPPAPPAVATPAAAPPAAVAGAAPEESSYEELEARAALLQNALLACQQELDSLPGPGQASRTDLESRAGVLRSSLLACNRALARVRARRDHRDETIAALRFRLAELSRSAHERSVATAAAFVYNPANHLSLASPRHSPAASPTPVGLELVPPRRSSSVSPIPSDLEPAASPSPPPARPRLRLAFGDGLRPGAASSTGRVSRVIPGPPPWASDQQP